MKYLRYFENLLLVLTGFIMGGIGGKLLFNFPYSPANFEIGSMIGSLVAIIYIIIKNNYYLK